MLALCIGRVSYGVPFVSKLRASTSIFLENLLSALMFEIRVDVYERRLAFSRRRLKSTST